MNADLGFSTRARAASGPEDLANLDQVNQAIGMISSSQDVDMATARARLQESSAKSGLPQAAVARAIIAFLRSGR
jgi:hypothetical protein